MLVRFDGVLPNFYLTDRQGSVLQISNFAGDPVKRLWYKGTDTDSRYPLDGNYIEDRFEYAGRPYDLQTHLQPFHSRWLIGSAGRFLTEDGDGTNLHPYAFARENPVNNVEPPGRQGRRRDSADEAPSWFKYIPFGSNSASMIESRLEGTRLESTAAVFSTAARSLDIPRGIAETLAVRARRTGDVAETWKPWQLASDDPWWNYGEAWSDFGTIGFDNAALGLTMIAGSTHDMLLDYRQARDGGVGPGWTAAGVGIFKNLILSRGMWTMHDAYDGHTYDGRPLSEKERTQAWVSGYITTSMDAITIGSLLLGGGGGARGPAGIPVRSGKPTPALKAKAQLSPPALTNSTRAVTRTAGPQLTLQRLAQPHLTAAVKPLRVVGGSIRNGARAIWNSLGNVPPSFAAALGGVHGVDRSPVYGYGGGNDLAGMPSTTAQP